MAEESLDLAAIARATAPLTNAHAMPAGFYTSDAIFAREREKIFLKGWVFAGREDQVPEPGDYRAIDTVGGPVILIRGSDGVLRAFANFCRHRGAMLLKGHGKSSRIICPYHAWSYYSDGRLYGCPDMADAEGFDRVENGLVPVRMESWSGFIFLCFDDDAPALAATLGDLPDRMASHRLDEMVCTWTIQLECGCNWKSILENAMETYHTGTVHRDSVGAQTSRSLATTGDWLCIQVLSGRSIATLPGEAPSFPQIAGLDDDALQGTYFTVSFTRRRSSRWRRTACGGCRSCRWQLTVRSWRLVDASRVRLRNSQDSKNARSPITNDGNRLAERIWAFWKISRKRWLLHCTARAPSPGVKTRCRRSGSGCWINWSFKGLRRAETRRRPFA